MVAYRGTDHRQIEDPRLHSWRRPGEAGRRADEEDGRGQAGHDDADSAQHDAHEAACEPRESHNASRTHLHRCGIVGQHTTSRLTSFDGRYVKIPHVREVQWEALPLHNEPVREIVYSGNGKDAELVLTFPDGSTGTVPSHHVSIASAAPIQLTIESLDDLNLAVRISGTALAVAAARVVDYYFDDEAEGRAEFLEDVAKWATPGRHDLGIVTPVDIELTAADRSVSSEGQLDSLR